MGTNTAFVGPWDAHSLTAAATAIEDVTVLAGSSAASASSLLNSLIDLPSEAPSRRTPGASGALYQAEVAVHWDSRPGGALRVLASIEDGRSRAFSPLCDGFILAPDGRFGGE